METLQRSAARATRIAGADARGTVFVDCIDPARRDVLVYWLTQAGYRVHESSATCFPSDERERNGADVLLTDRFGPGLPGEATIFQLKEARPGLRVIVLGHGDPMEEARLSLARAAGADATLPAPLDRGRVLHTLDRGA
jgi:AmiR/NasT family two-component response regulator